MSNLDKDVAVSLHTLSHIAQSLLMRIQADMYVIEQTRKDEIGSHQKETEGQYFQRCKASVTSISSLLEQLFQFLYMCNQPYVEHRQSMDVVEWWRGLSNSFATQGSDIVFQTALEDTVATLDFSLLEWVVRYCVLAAVQWRQPSTQVRVMLSKSHSDQFEVYVEFVPSATGGQGDPVVPQNEAVTLGEFYWAAAKKASELLGGTLVPHDPFRSGNMTLKCRVEISER